MSNFKLRSVQLKPEHFKKYEVRAICQSCDNIAIRYYEELGKKIDLSCLNCGNHELIDSDSRQMIAKEAIELEQLLQANFSENDKAVVHRIEYNSISKNFTVWTYQARFMMELFKFIEKVYGYKLISFNMQSSALIFQRKKDNLT